ncbi:related to AGA1 A-agglutinin anchor subunit [Phialocephala subalpina]|uniref:Related to AGA1 A-agglutinin anchor subunit n=1 Tax=Phialocephala subalpina TaxID=576137 RepID=A0A1L7X2J9_9HELO|nr:related to AGA1 A-agglutinin anchor subunit [Phialocephala subalpina]
MRASRSFQLYSILLLYLSAYAAAWPIWPRWLPELDSIIVRRQDSNTTATGSGSATATGSTSKSGGGTTTFSMTGSGSASATGSGKSSGSGSTGKTSSTKTSHTSYDARLPAGGVSMITPSVAAGEQYYKIGDFVTFAWNYTSLSATPTAINVMASCSANSQVYTITMNQTVANSTGAVTWDTGNYQATAVQNPLLTETYTLVIYDAASGMSATAQAGYLAVYDSYTFGMYTPQPYTPLADFQCATCSGALSDMEKRALGMMFGMACLTVLSFTWFVSGTGIIW